MTAVRPGPPDPPDLGSTRAPQRDDAIIRLEQVSKSFGDLHVLRGVTLRFRRGRSTVILGPSGSGKSVMLKHIVGLLKPDAGEIWFENTRVDALSERRLVPIRREIGFLFQQGALFDSMNVLRNVSFPLLEHTSLDSDERRARAEDVLRLVGLPDILEKMPSDLSGGQRKRVALARAIILRPKVVLYDEPTTGLDPIRADVINELILKLQRELRVTSIVVTHDLASAFKVADHMVMLHDGRIAAQGDPDAFRRSDDPVVQRFLAGEASPEELGWLPDRPDEGRKSAPAVREAERAARS